MARSPIHIIKINVVQVGVRHFGVSFLYEKNCLINSFINCLIRTLLQFNLLFCNVLHIHITASFVITICIPKCTQFIEGGVIMRIDPNEEDLREGYSHIAIKLIKRNAP
ncbi:hypothetical protein pE33L466_0429 (plasmid) [Bacillus cereus E33L]|uniref:Uncharacterized protein n=1 Tax=Bacillus cereus (strain ZK / E33L) TaxID=288681 RepID=Q4V140_BACCZ|nr:hypothetical protein pE33L466_0429 [Bacillus cereus E33L]